MALLTSNRRLFLLRSRWRYRGHDAWRLGGFRDCFALLLNDLPAFPYRLIIQVELLDLSLQFGWRWFPDDMARRAAMGWSIGREQGHGLEDRLEIGGRDLHFIEVSRSDLGLESPDCTAEQSILDQALPSRSQEIDQLHCQELVFSAIGIGGMRLLSL